MNNSPFTFDPLFPVWTITVMTILLFVFILWKEVRRKQRFLTMRIIAQLLIIISILGLVLRPFIYEEKKSPDSILLTRGYSTSKVDSLLKKYPKLHIITTDNASTYSNSEVLPNLQDLSSIGDGIRFIVGEGLSHDALELISVKSFRFIPGKSPGGVSQLFINKPVRVSQFSSIHGTFNALDNSKLKLVGPSGPEDSISLKKGVSNFSFSIKPRQAGLFIYELTSQVNGNTITEKVPIEVVLEKKLSILILQKFPTAEIRYLKNYLAEKGHKLAVRYQTSKTNFKYEFANCQSYKIERITPELASSIDLLIVDSQVLTELNSSEKAALENAIRSGLGVIIPDIPEKEKTITQFLPLKLKPVALDTVHLQTHNSRQYVLPVQPVLIMVEPALQSITTHHGRILSGYIFAGAGKVAFQLLKETYRIRLEGNVDDYASIWSPLIEKTARAAKQNFKISIDNSFPYFPDESLFINIISSGLKPSVYTDKTFLPVQEDVIIDDSWNGKSWAGAPGWHSFSIKQDTTKINYFVSEKGEWSASRFNNQVKENFLNEASTDQPIDGKTVYTSKEISPFLFFLLFLISSGFLWLAPKI